LWVKFDATFKPVSQGYRNFINLLLMKTLFNKVCKHLVPVIYLAEVV
jgi:hypothetical protein